MQLAAPQLSQHLQRGLKSLYTLHGDEPLLIQEAADAIRAHARTQGYTERTVHTASGAHFDLGRVAQLVCRQANSRGARAHRQAG
jgi:DNA polymerase III subunit delta